MKSEMSDFNSYNARRRRRERYLTVVPRCVVVWWSVAVIENVINKNENVQLIVCR